MKYLVSYQLTMSDIILFQNKKIRREWIQDHEERVFSVVDIVWLLSKSKDGRKYRNKLKQRLNEEWSEVVTNCHQLKMIAKDGKMRLTDVANTETMLRIIQSIPSPNAEPIKRWLAEVWAERINEMNDPELAMERAMKYYSQKWYDESWINQRLKSIEIRKELTNEQKNVWIQEWQEYAILTNEITKARSGKSIKEYKQYKQLKQESLRDNMSNLELVLNMLAEASTTEISKEREPKDFKESKEIAKAWGNVAKKARKELEDQTAKSIVSNKNMKSLEE